jgi:hypothetical protein
VLLALLLNEWRAESAERARVGQALEAIRAEIAENQSLVRFSLEYHQRLVTAFTAAAQAGAETPDLDVATYGLFNPARVLRAAWESAQTAGFPERVPYDTVLELSAMYARQDEYAALGTAARDSLYDQVMRVGRDSVLQQYRNFIVIQNDFVGREQLLLESYDHSLGALPPP